LDLKKWNRMRWRYKSKLNKGNYFRILFSRIYFFIFLVLEIFLDFISLEKKSRIFFFQILLKKPDLGGASARDGPLCNRSSPRKSKFDKNRSDMGRFCKWRLQILVCPGVRRHLTVVSPNCSVCPSLTRIVHAGTWSIAPPAIVILGMKIISSLVLIHAPSWFIPCEEKATSRMY